MFGAGVRWSVWGSAGLLMVFAGVFGGVHWGWQCGGSRLYLVICCGRASNLLPPRSEDGLDHFVNLLDPDDRAAARLLPRVGLERRLVRGFTWVGGHRVGPLVVKFLKKIFTFQTSKR